jgi:hypothetical protein
MGGWEAPSAQEPSRYGHPEFGAARPPYGSAIPPYMLPAAVYHLSVIARVIDYTIRDVVRDRLCS